MSERAFLACCRVTPDRSATVPGAMQMKCAECSAAVWVSPASLTHIADQSGGVFTIACVECMVERAKTDPPEYMPPSAGQVEEVREWLKGDARL